MNPMLTTEQFAQLAGVKPASIRAAYCRQGSYFGIYPKKLRSGRLLWPCDSIDRLTVEVNKPDEEAAK